MLIRYCTAHARHFGYPRLLGVRWNGWVVSTVGGLCEACRDRERGRWEPDPYGSVLIPVPVELGPRTLGRRVLGALIAAAAAAVVTTAALLVVHPPDLIPSGGEPGLVSSGARLAGPAEAQADTSMDRPAASRPRDTRRAVSHAVATRAALTGGQPPASFIFARGCPAPLGGMPAIVRVKRVAVPAAQSP